MIYLESGHMNLRLEYVKYGEQMLHALSHWALPVCTFKAPDSELQSSSFKFDIQIGNFQN
jgi:hypothetical protein